MDKSMFNKLIKIKEDVVKYDEAINYYKYYLVSFEDTYMIKDAIKSTPFRKFEAVPVGKPSKRKQNDTQDFDVYTDTLFDYPIILKNILGEEFDPLEDLNYQLTVQIPFCGMDCWHCYNDKKTCHGSISGLKEIKGDPERHYYTADNILDSFVECKNQGLKEEKEKRYNILRVSGGEPFIAIELIAQLLEKISTSSNKDYPKAIWTETNLIPWATKEDGESFIDYSCEKALENGLDVKKIFNNYYNKLVIHPCFHGITDRNIVECTSNSKIYLSDLKNGFKNLNLFVTNETTTKTNLNIYPTFIAEATDPEGLPDFFQFLYDIDKSFPLKIAVIYADDYPPVCERIKERTGTFKCYSKYAILKRWNMFIKKHYDVDYAQIIRPNAEKIIKDDRKFDNPIKNSNLSNYVPILYLLKSKFRNEYHQELLSILAAPVNCVVTTTYDKKHIDNSTYICLKVWENKYLNKKIKTLPQVILVYAQPESSDEEFKYLPLRKGKLLNLKVTDKFVHFEILVNDYIFPTAFESEKSVKQFNDRLINYFGRKTLLDRPNSKWVLLGEEAIIKGWEKNYTSLKISNSSFVGTKEQEKAWDALIKIITESNLSGFGAKAIFCQLLAQKLPTGQKFSDNEILLKEGEKVEYRMRYYIPEFEYYDKRKTLNDERTLIIKTTAENLSIAGYEPRPLAKYGEFNFVVTCNKLEFELPAKLIIKSKIPSALHPSLSIDLKLKKECASGGSN